jgi:hypothetical protein
MVYADRQRGRAREICKGEDVGYAVNVFFVSETFCVDVNIMLCAVLMMMSKVENRKRKS